MSRIAREKICGIYKIISPSNRIYVGSSKDINLRWGFYKRLACEDQPKLYNSLKKYTPEAHVFEIVEECEFDLLFQRERYYQEMFECTGNNGLNCNLVKTDEKPFVRSLESRKRGADKLRGIPRSEETKQKLREALLGRKISEEQRIVMKLARGNRACYNYYSYIQRTLEGVFIKFYKNIQALRDSGFNSNCILAYVNKKQKNYKNFLWEKIPYTENYTEEL